MLKKSRINNDVLVIKSFRDKARGLFRELNGMNLDEMETYIRAEVERIVEEYGLDVNIEDVLIYGSRTKGTESIDSDLDVILYYCGLEREDSLFNILHEEDMIIGNVIVDINPISQTKIGSLSEYLKNTIMVDCFL